MRSVRFAALESANFRLYFFGLAFGQGAVWVQRTAQAWLVLELTGSPAAVGLISAVQTLPALAFGLFVGALTDRLPKRRLIMTMQGAAVVQSVVTSALVLGGGVQLWQLYVLAFVLGTITVAENTSRQTFISEMVSREQMPSAVSLNSTASSVARILGPTAAGLAIVTLGMGWAFVLQACATATVLLRAPITAVACWRSTSCSRRGPRRSAARSSASWRKRGGSRWR